MRGDRLLLVLLVLAVSACAGRGSVYSGRTGAAAVEALYDRIDSHGRTPAAVRRSLGEPLRIDTTTMANRHGYGTDTVFTVSHPHWIHTYLRLGASGNELVTAVETTDPKVRFPGGITIGATTADELRTRLGPPDQETPSGNRRVVLAWRNPAMDADSFVEFALVRDTVRLVRWVPYVD